MGQLTSLIASADAVQSTSGTSGGWGSGGGKGQRRSSKRARDAMMRVQKAEDVPSYKGSWPVDQLVEYIDSGSGRVKQYGSVQVRKEVTVRQQGVIALKKRSSSKKDPTESDSGCGDCILVDQGDLLTNPAEILSASIAQEINAMSENDDSDVSPFFLCQNPGNGLIIDADCSFNNRYLIQPCAKNTKDNDGVIDRLSTTIMPSQENDSSEFIPVQRRRTKVAATTDISKRLSSQKSKGLVHSLVRHDKLCSTSSTDSTSSSQSSYASANSSVRSTSPVDSEQNISTREMVNNDDNIRETISSAALSSENSDSVQGNLDHLNENNSSVNSNDCASSSTIASSEESLLGFLTSSSGLSFFASDTVVDPSTSLNDFVNDEASLTCNNLSSNKTSMAACNVSCSSSRMKCKHCEKVHRTNSVEESNLQNLTKGCSLSSASVSRGIKSKYSLKTSTTSSASRQSFMSISLATADTESVPTPSDPVVFLDGRIESSPEMNDLQFGFDCDVKQYVVLPVKSLTNHHQDVCENERPYSNQDLSRNSSISGLNLSLMCANKNYNHDKIAFENGEKYLDDKLLSVNEENCNREKVRLVNGENYKDNKVSFVNGENCNSDKIKKKSTSAVDQNIQKSVVNGKQKIIRRNLHQLSSSGGFDLKAAQYFCYSVYCQVVQDVELGKTKILWIDH